MKPILFSTDMVRAILEGRKTVTRRVVKQKGWEITGRPKWGEKDGIRFWFDVANEKTATTHRLDPPYKPGEILYVRETWRTDPFRCGEYCYRASDLAPDQWPYQPSIHMPKEAARIFLRVADVRVERLQNITEEQALAEGATGVPCDHPDLFVAGGTVCCVDCMNTGWLEPPKVNFSEVWDNTIKKTERSKYGWAANPWVWVVEFEKVGRETAEMLDRSTSNVR